MLNLPVLYGSPSQRVVQLHRLVGGHSCLVLGGEGGGRRGGREEGGGRERGEGGGRGRELVVVGKGQLAHSSSQLECHIVSQIGNVQQSSCLEASLGPDQVAACKQALSRQTGIRLRMLLLLAAALV